MLMARQEPSDTAMVAGDETTGLRSLRNTSQDKKRTLRECLPA